MAREPRSEEHAPGVAGRRVKLAGLQVGRDGVGVRLRLDVIDAKVHLGRDGIVTEGALPFGVARVRAQVGPRSASEEVHLGPIGASFDASLHDGAMAEAHVGNKRWIVRTPQSERKRDEYAPVQVKHEAGKAEGFTGEYLGSNKRRVYQAGPKGELLAHDRKLFRDATLPKVGERMHVSYHPTQDRVDVRELPAREPALTHDTGREIGD